MKFKTLKHKISGEYVVIVHDSAYTSDIPRLLPLSCSYNMFKTMYPEIDFSQYEMIEMDVFESGELGADIRNKLTPLLNLVKMVQHLETEKDEDVKVKMKKIMLDSIDNYLETITYLAKLV